MGRPRKNPVAEVATTTETEKNFKVADAVSANVKKAKKAKGSELTRKELTEACKTPKDMIDERGLFMGENYTQIKKRKHGEEELEALANLHVYDPVQEKMIVRVYFLGEFLGVTPGNPEMLSSHVANMTMNATTRDQEIEALGAQAVIDKGREHFDVVNGQLQWKTHRWLAYIREQSQQNSYVKGTLASKCANLKNNVLNRISFTSDFCPIVLPEGAELSICDRPMPGDGYKRETSIKSSESAPTGTVNCFVIQIKNILTSGNENKPKGEPLVKEVVAEALDCGVLRGHGTGGWRGSGGYGTFLWEELDTNGVVIGGNTFKYLGTTSNEEDFKEKFYAFADSKTTLSDVDESIVNFSL